MSSLNNSYVYSYCQSWKIPQDLEIKLSFPFCHQLWLSDDKTCPQLHFFPLGYLLQKPCSLPDPLLLILTSLTNIKHRTQMEFLLYWFPELWLKQNELIQRLLILKIYLTGQKVIQRVVGFFFFEVMSCCWKSCTSFFHFFPEMETGLEQ